MFTVLTGFACGFGMPVQTCINTRLIKRSGTPYTSSLINFVTGEIILLVITLFVEGTLLIPFGKLSPSDLWMMTGGCFAVVFVTANILLMPKLGSVQTVILPALGQILMGSLIEQFGLFNSVGRSMNILRITGVILVFAGVCVIVLSRAGKKSGNTSDSAGLWGYRLLGVAGGCCMACQTAVNSQLGLVLESRLFAAVTNFTVAIIILIIMNICVREKIKAAKKERVPAWAWTGGVFGFIYVIGNIIVGQRFGPGFAVVLVLTGMMTSSLLIDQFGWFSSPKRKISAASALGLVMMISGAAMFHLL